MTSIPTSVEEASVVAEGTSYTDAARELEGIVAELESGSLDVDAVVVAVARASALVEFCQAKVRSAQARVSDITSKVGA